MRRNIFKRFGSLALLCVLLAQLCCPAFAEDDTIYLNDAEDLLDFAASCAYDAWSRGKTVILQRDISLGGVEFAPAASFGGTFEGGGHTISGLHIGGSVSPAGLFGEIAATGTVRDLNLEGSVSPNGSGDVAGGIAGVNRGLISGCTFAGTVEAQRHTGGIAGENAAGGTIRRCTVTGGVFGKNMTGGVTGVNHGTVSACTNRAYVNTNTLDPSISFDQLDLSLTGLSSLMSPDNYNIIVDSGGVAGFSDGQLLGCRNFGSVGYQHVGYNVGGIAGRSSGHVASCVNEGRVYGRREVGGVVGMAEPYIRLDLRESSVEEVRRQLNALSSTINKTVDDAEAGAGTVSARLTLINGGVADASTHAQTLTGRLSDTYDETISEVNRASEVLSVTIDQLADVTQDMIVVSDTMTTALGNIESAMNDLNSGAGGNAFDEAKAAADDVGRASDILDAGVEQMQDGLKSIESALEASGGIIDDDVRAQLSGAVTELRGGLEILTDGRGGASGDRGGVGYYLNDSVTHLNNVLTDVKAASAHLQTAAGELQDASGELSTALRDAERLLRYLDAQEKLQFPTFGDETDAEADALYDSLRGVSNNLELLNQEAKSASDTVLEDVRQINRQFTALMNTLLDVVEDVEGMTPSAVVEDTSDEDVDGVLTGKVLLCENRGTVSGDIDVGGVAGAMMVYNELDPENDNEDLSSAFHKRYELKCILQDCANSGGVVGKRDNVGSVCGSATLGVISGCEGYGSAESESGDYVGGIAGSADNIVRRCWAKCSLSGAKYIGGIVGAGRAENAQLRVEGCRSLVDITRSEQYAGAVIGREGGTLTDNRFVSDTLAGIGRVSYTGRAEPVAYEDLIAEEGAPKEFSQFTLSFVANGSMIRSLRFNYGDSFDDSVFPDIPELEGQFAQWDRDDLNDLRFDTTVTAVYLPRLSAVGSGLTRSAARPTFFVEGAFDGDASFTASPAIFDFDAGQEGAWRILRAYRREIQEQWQLTLPEDGALVHTVRYLPAEDAAGALELYARSGDGVWTRLETGKMGSYLTFDTSARSLDLTVVSAATPWWVWAIVNVFLLGVAALLAVLLIRKRPKAALTDEEKAKAAQRKKKRGRLRVILIAAVIVLGGATAAVIRFAPRITDSMGLYMMLRNYAERSDIDTALTLSARVNGEALNADVRIYQTDCGDKRVSCVMWQDIPIYFCDGALLLENGKAYRADGVLPDYGQLLPRAAGLFRAVDVAMSEENGVKTYHASVEGEDADHLIETLLPDVAQQISETKTADLDLIVTDGELTSLRVEWNGAAGAMTAEFSALEKTEHTLPAPVRSTIISGECARAPEIGEELRRLVLAWTELVSRDPLTANVSLAANCGPLLLDESLTWQRTRAYAKELSCVSRGSMALYFTEDAACTARGVKTATVDSGYRAPEKLVRLAYQAFLLGEADCVSITDGWRYSVTLSADEMADFAAAIAPETQALGVVPTEGTVRLELRDDAITALSVQCKGTMRVVRTDISAAVSGRLTFDRDAAFPAPSEAALSALGLGE